MIKLGTSSFVVCEIIDGGCCAVAVGDWQIMILVLKYRCNVIYENKALIKWHPSNSDDNSFLFSTVLQHSRLQSHIIYKRYTLLMLRDEMMHLLACYKNFHNTDAWNHDDKCGA